MGTRADFYVGRGTTAEWLGSIAWDGNPSGVFEDPTMFATPITEDDWRTWVTQYLASRDDATTPEQGWPWPWSDSNTTDYAYAWDSGVIFGSYNGWFRVDPDAEYWGEVIYGDFASRPAFPDMSSRRAMTLGRRSGVIAVGSPADES